MAEMMVAAHESAAQAEAARREAHLQGRIADLEAEIEQLRARWWRRAG